MIIGIDLGTTNSLIAVWRQGKAELIPNALGSYLTPSVVHLDDVGNVIVGQAAKDLHYLHPTNCIANFKRSMGTKQLFQLGSQQFRAEELSSLVLKQLKDDAERYLGEPVTEAVISVPAYFNDAQRKATKVAGELAGLKVERLINEPTAAALAYGLHEQSDEKSFLIFDLGGGTFDVSILELFDNVMEVRASAGDNYLGGEDVVDLLIEEFRKQVNNSQIDWDDPHFIQRLHNEAERVKRILSSEKSATFTLQINGEEQRWHLTEVEFERLLKPLLLRLRTPLETAIRDAKLNLAELDHIVLVGGATRMPVIRSLVAKMFGKLPYMNLHPDEVIVQGAAIQAALKVRNQELEDIVVTDVCPYSLGVDTCKSFGQTFSGGYFSPIIERNSSVPISRVESYTTIQDNQKSITFGIYQGESHKVSNNILLDEITIDLPLRPRGEVQIDVRFSYDINGLLEVDMFVPETGKHKNLLIEQHSTVLSADEKAKALERLQRLKIHPQDQQQNIALLAKLDKLYQMSLGEQREWLTDCALRFNQALATQDEKIIAPLRTQLNQLLSELSTEHLF